MNRNVRKRTYSTACAPVKIQISLRIRTVWSKSSLSAFWIAKQCLHVDNKDSEQSARMRRLIWVLVGGHMSELTVSHVASQFLSVLCMPCSSIQVIVHFDRFSSRWYWSYQRKWLFCGHRQTKGAYQIQRITGTIFKFWIIINRNFLTYVACPNLAITRSQGIRGLFIIFVDWFYNFNIQRNKTNTIVNNSILCVSVPNITPNNVLYIHIWLK